MYMNESNPLSFLPEDYLERKAQRRTNIICAILAGIVMAAIGSAFSLTEKVNRQAELNHSRVESQYVSAAKQIQQFQQMEAEETKMASQAELTSSLLEKVPRSIVLAQVTNSVPKGVLLTDMTLDSRRRNIKPPPADAAKAAAAQPEPIVYDVTVSISGVAGDDVQVADFIHRLGESPLFKDVNLVISDEFSKDDANAKLRRFEVNMSINNEADATNVDVGTINKNTTARVPTN
jgi:Tfp pilus assembly protein PilN